MYDGGRSSGRLPKSPACGSADPWVMAEISELVVGMAQSNPMAHVSRRPLGNRCGDRLLHRRGRHSSQARDLLCARRHRAVFAKSTHCRNNSLGPSGLFPPLAVVPLPRNQPSVPSQQGFRCDDSGDFCQEFPAKRLTLYREPTSLVVCETKLPPAKSSFEDFVLLEQVDNSGLLVTLEPTSDGDDQQGQGLDRCAHDRGF